MDVMPVSVSMLVYIDAASAEKSLASGGNWMFFRSLMTENEFFM